MGQVRRQRVSQAHDGALTSPPVSTVVSSTKSAWRAVVVRISAQGHEDEMRSVRAPLTRLGERPLTQRTEMADDIHADDHDTHNATSGMD